MTPAGRCTSRTSATTHTGDGLAQAEPALIGQHSRHRARERLAVAADTEQRVGRDGRAAAAVAIAGCVDELAVGDDGDGELGSAKVERDGRAVGQEAADERIEAAAEVSRLQPSTTGGVKQTRRASRTRMKGYSDI